MSFRFVSCAAAAVLLAAGAPAAQAQDGFLFGPPDGQVTLRAGPMFFRAQSELFDWMVDTLTVSRRDFRGPSMALELAWLSGQRLDFALGIGWAETERDSEYRYWVGDDEEPIRQFTTLQVVPVSVTLRFRPLERGRRLSNLAWLPARTSPYVGLGGGLIWYKLVQEGEFIRSSLAIYEDRLESSDWGPAAHAVAGIDYWVTPKVAVSAEARYNVGSASLDERVFRGFDDLDLSGAQVSLGFSYRW
jgi:hypothetical protein